MCHHSGKIVFLLFLSSWFSDAQVIGKYMERGFLTNQFSAQTAFFWTHPMQSLLENDLMNVTVGNRTCTAVHANLLSRHAARYPSVGTMIDFTKLHEKIKNAYQNQSYYFIEKWNSTYQTEKEDMVTELGVYEMEHLGRMYGTRLKDLFTPGFNTRSNESSIVLTDRLQFGATSKTRTQTSAKIFSDWLSVVVTGYNHTLDRLPIRDQVLRFFDNCKSYDMAASDKQEMVKFEKGPRFQKVIHNVAEKLQLNATLTIDDVKTLYKLCATELAINDNPDWCTLLSKEDLDVLQYNGDIERNIQIGYGSQITGQMSCPLATDIFTALDDVIQDRQYGGQNHTLGMFQFGHLPTVIDFFSGLGLFKDNLPITADNYELLKHRNFNTAKIGTFSTHLVFILYECGGTSNSDYAVKLLVNGEPENIPGFNSDVSKYQDVRQHYRHLVEGCNRDKLCQDGTIPPVIVG